MKTKFLFLILILFLFFPIFFTHAASSGPNSPGTAADDTTVGSENWGFLAKGGATVCYPDGALTSDDTYAGVRLDENENSYYLKLTDFGFAIPSSATVNGITLSVERRSRSLIGDITDFSIRLLQDGAFAGNNKANTVTLWSSDVDETATYGGATDEWGLTWTSAQINSTTFGVGISVHDTNAFQAGQAPCDASVDFVTVTVHYTEGASSSSGGSKKAISYPSYTTKFSPNGSNSMIAENILFNQPVEYVNNYPQSQTSSPKASSTPPISVTPTPIASDTAPIASNPQEQDIINQLWILYLELKRQVEELVLSL